ncbi:NAD(P)H-quinone oxidoreductase chain 4, chloroplastic, partial [Linum perenne]
EIFFYIVFLIAFAVKLPIIPFHTWLPDTHGEAHYSTCMLLAGILLKMGAYGLIRINMEFLPHAHSIFSPFLIMVGAIQIIYAASTSSGQRNLKKRVAYSSVSHMGFLIIGICSMSDTGLNGAVLTNSITRIYWCCTFFLGGSGL